MPSDHVRRLHASNGLHLSATPGGCVAAIECGATLVNQVVASPVAGGVHHRYREALDEPVGERTVGEAIQAARRAGAPVQRAQGTTTVEVVAGITTTLGGLRVDEQARAAEGLFAAGADVGGISTGGWSSALAAALVLGKLAAESAVS